MVELVDDPRRDKWCATPGIAMGRSINVVFGRLAQKHLTPEDLTAMSGAFGFGAPVPFPVANQAPKIELPEEPVEFARAAAGFWHTTLSPLAGASLAFIGALGLLRIIASGSLLGAYGESTRLGAQLLVEPAIEDPGKLGSPVACDPGDDDADPARGQV